LQTSIAEPGATWARLNFYARRMIHQLKHLVQLHRSRMHATLGSGAAYGRGPPGPAHLPAAASRGEPEVTGCARTEVVLWPRLRPGPGQPVSQAVSPRLMRSPLLSIVKTSSNRAPRGCSLGVVWRMNVFGAKCEKVAPRAGFEPATAKRGERKRDKDDLRRD
jgi:hypothetical protein